MPYLIQKTDKGEFCIYKKGADGTPTGESLGCHPSKSKATNQLRAIYANTKEMEDTLHEYTIGEFRGDYPDVPVAVGVNLDELKTLDADPFFVTLPIVPEIGAISKNGLLYDEELVNSIAEQINSKRPDALFGHLKDEERDTAFPIPSGMWVGAQRVGKALWAKAYVPPGEARNHLKRLKAIGGKIATSIYGTPGTWEQVKEGVRRATNFTLESLDFAPPSRAALGAGAVPVVTSEFEQEEAEVIMDKSQVIAELKAVEIPQTLRNQIVQEWQLANGKAVEPRVAELTTQLGDARKLVSELQVQLTKLQAAQLQSTLDTRIAELINWLVKGDDARKKMETMRSTFRLQVVARMTPDTKPEQVAELVNQAWADFQPLAETVRDALAGPPAIVNGKVRNGNDANKLNVTPEATAAAVAKFNINF